MSQIVKSQQSQQQPPQQSPAPKLTVVEQQCNLVQGLIANNWKSIQSIISNTITPERLARVTLNEIRKNPTLAECEPVSLLACMMESAALGLEPGSLGEVYFVPRNNKKGYKEACFQTGYKGLMSLARRGGEVTKIGAYCVYEGDVFEYQLGLDEKLHHIPKAEDLSDSKITHVYAVATLKSGERQFECLTRNQIEAAKQKSGSEKFWGPYYAAMAKKTAIRKLSKWLPQSALEKRLSEVEDATSILDVVNLGIPAIPPPNSAPAITAERIADEKDTLRSSFEDVCLELEANGFSWQDFTKLTKDITEVTEAEIKQHLPKLQAYLASQQGKAK